MKKLFLGICFTLLISTSILAKDATSAKAIKVDVLAKTCKSWDNDTLPNYSTGQPEVTILKIEIPPKFELPLHNHPIINAGVLLEGELTVITDKNDTLHLKAGDPIVEVVGTKHFGINEGLKPAVIIVFYAGIVEKPITVKEKK